MQILEYITYIRKIKIIHKPNTEREREKMTNFQNINKAYI